MHTIHRKIVFDLSVSHSQLLISPLTVFLSNCLSRIDDVKDFIREICPQGRGLVAPLLVLGDPAESTLCRLLASPHFSGQDTAVT